MEIGILTFSRVHNYGAILQCYALSETLKQMGHNVKVIEYKQPFLEAINRPFVIKEFMGRLANPRSFCRYIKQYKARLLSDREYEYFKSTYLNCTQPCDAKHIPTYFDLYIIGSDQVWGVNCTNGVDKVFLGFFERKKNSRVAAYAISSNIKSIEFIGESLLKNALSNFSDLSFREPIIAEKISRISEKAINVHLDPTLIADKNIWTRFISDKYKDKRYVLVYEVRYRNKSYLMEKAKEYALKHNCEILNPSACKCNPMEFVSLFKYAYYIITTSFHGTIFGLIFNKPMSVFCLNDGHDSRYVELLNKVGASAFLHHIDEPLKETVVDYELVNKKLEILKQNSIEYLKSL